MTNKKVAKKKRDSGKESWLNPHISVLICGCFGSLLKMFQAQFQISLLNTHAPALALKRANGNSVMNLLKCF